MSNIEITLIIPEDLAKDAQEFDALNAETMRLCGGGVSRARSGLAL